MSNASLKEEMGVGDLRLVTSPAQPEKGELHQGFGIWSLLTLAITVGGYWGTALQLMAVGLVSGGPAVLLWGVLILDAGTLALGLTLGEMASAYPSAAGPVEYAYQFAPKRWAREFSYLTGCLLYVGYFTGAVATFAIPAQQVVYLAIAFHPDYVPKQWHVELVMQGLLFLCIMLNIYGIKLIEHWILVWFVGGWLIWCIVPIATTESLQKASFVFGSFINETGWGSMPTYKELPNPRIDLPRAMWMSPVAGSTMTFIVTVLVLFAMSDVEGTISAPTGLPYAQIVLDATGSPAAMVCLTVILTGLSCAACLSIQVATTRIAFSFAREGGLVFPETLAKIHPKLQVPVNAIIFCWILEGLLSLLYLGPTTAYNSFLSLVVILSLTAYAVCIVLLLLRKRHYSPVIPTHPFKLPNLIGWVLNSFSLVFCLLLAVFLYFPTTNPTSVLSMNYAVVIVAGFGVMGLAGWFVSGRKTYAIDRSPDPMEL
ncbi:hypothetical protein JCM10207_000509 [Rhodosporidiobolus poonsookiae]